MIAKGSSRSGPRQLAVYLMRVERYDTGEPALLLELQSPWAAPENGGRTADRLVETFRDWQILTEGTKQGRDGLYHAQISPEARYARTMTPEQWKRAADILGEELGLKDQPRAVVLHGGEDRPHLHVVWARTDIDAMKVVSDSQNYLAHERASQRMELEFGQEFVPGKHAKRDRKKQPEFPREKMSRGEAQQAERLGMSKQEREEQITALRAASDNALGFKAALEDAGYILAKGDKRGFVLVDGEGESFSLSRYVTDLKARELKAFMAGIDPAALPTVDEAKALQAEKPAKAELRGAESGPVQAPEPSKFLPQEFPAPQAQPFAAPPEASKFLQPPPAEKQPQPVQAPADAELEALKKALAERQAKEAGKWAELHAAELRQFEHELDILTTGKTADFDVLQQQEREALSAAHKEKRKGIKGFIDAIQSKLKPKLAAEKAKERRREAAQLKARQERERKDYLALLGQNRQLEIENLKERQALRNRDQEQKRAEEQERYIREHQEAKRILAELETEREELERNDSLREGPPPPKLGK